MIQKSLITLSFMLVMAGFFASPIQALTTPTPTQEATPSAEPTSTDDTTLNKTVQSLKEKIENKVEQMNKKTRKIIKGTITKIQKSTITLKTESDVEYTVTLDDTVTSILTASLEDQEELTASDLEKDDYVIVSGPVIENQVSANRIYKQTQYTVLQGHITAINKDAFTIDVLTLDKDTYTLDIENTTKQVLMNSKTLALEKSGFSKFQIGDNIHAVIIKPAKDAKTVETLRTLIIPQEYFTQL